MFEDLLAYYNAELNYIREIAAEFGHRHPDVAAQLQLRADQDPDPHVERLIQAFALLGARVRYKIEDDFPELTDSLLQVLYPHYLSPIPSMGIVAFRPNRELDGPYQIPAGTEVETEPVLDTVRCRYRSCYDATVWPIRIASALLSGLPLKAPPNRIARERRAEAVLRITLSCLSETKTFADLSTEWEKEAKRLDPKALEPPPPRLRFFLNGTRNESCALYEALFNKTVSVALGASDKRLLAEPMGGEALVPVGFGLDEGVLPYGARSFVGYRLLTEHFALPEKFLFFDVAGIDADAMRHAGQTLDLFIYLTATSPDLERQVSAQTFVLGATPVVNLFQQRAEPFALSHNIFEYPIYPDRKHGRAYEVHSIDAVTASRGDERRTVRPFYATSRVDEASGQPFFWHAMRRPARGDKPGSEVFLSFVDLDFDPSSPADWRVSVETTCTNRDLPENLASGQGEPKMTLVEGAAEVARVDCLTMRRKSLRLPSRKGARWRLISHLNLNHLSLFAGEAQEHGRGAEVLREILRLYDVGDSDETRKIIASVMRIDYRRGTARVPFRTISALGHGINVDVTFDDSSVPMGRLFLLACVLERFLGYSCSINSFVRLTAHIAGREDPLKTWLPRTGDRTLL